MKAILKFKPLFIVLALITIAMSSVNAAGISNTVKIDDVFEYKLSSEACPLCSKMTFWLATDENGLLYHGYCSTCGHEIFF